MSGPKLWLDPSDPATRFQDQAGTTLVTADGQPYGRANDKSGGIANDVGQVTTTSRPLWRTDGVLSWAQADGVDDSWQSISSLDLTPTDKITVIIGQRKESDAALGMLLEHGVSGVSPLSFSISAPRAAAQPNYGVQMRDGTNEGNAIPSGHPAPSSAVLTALLDYSGGTPGTDVVFRVNGAPTASGGTNVTAASFGNYVLHLLRKNANQFPFSGRFYGLMVFGRLLTADELSLCERYMAQKSGILLP